MRVHPGCFGDLASACSLPWRDSCEAEKQHVVTTSQRLLRKPPDREALAVTLHLEIPDKEASGKLLPQLVILGTLECEACPILETSSATRNR